MSKKRELQHKLFQKIQYELERKGQTIGSVMPEVLGISKDAVYRRYRMETDVTLDDLHKIKEQLGISIDALLGKEEPAALFYYNPIMEEGFSLEAYFDRIRQNLEQLHQQGTPRMILTVNNTPFFPVFNFPNLLKAKLFFWIKKQMRLDALKNVSYDDFYFSMRLVQTSYEILKLYNKVPSKELYDPDMLKGFVREVYYYYTSNEIDNRVAVELYNDMIHLVKHLKEQARNGVKYEYGKKPIPSAENQLEVYYNEILNATAMFYYTTEKAEGLFLTQNFLNPIHTTNQYYVKDTHKLLGQMISASSKISLTNSKTRDRYFTEIIQMIERYRKKVIFESENQAH